MTNSTLQTTCGSGNTTKNKLYGVVVAAIMVLLLPSCARTISFNQSVIVPAATGKIKVSKDKNDNYAFNVRVKNLAKPANIEPPGSTYVLWMDSERRGVKNLGQLKTSKGLFGGSLNASLKTVTPFVPVRFFITAEDNAEMEYTRRRPVLQTDSYHD